MNIQFQGYELIIDEEDFELFNKYKWRVLKRPDSHTVYLQATSRDIKNEYFHRIILGIKVGNKIRVDHRNGNGMDNRKVENLRIANFIQNGRNQIKVEGKTYAGKLTSSRFKGVSFYKRDSNYSAYIMLPGKHKIHLGYFNDDVLAAKAYNDAALKYFGEFACLNKV